MANTENYSENYISITKKDADVFDHVKNYCRLCLSCEETVSDIFDLYYEDQKLSDILYHCTSIQVQEMDSFSHNICSACITQLITLFQFIENCRSSDKLLKSSFSKLVNCENDNEGIKSDIKTESSNSIDDVDIKTSNIDCNGSEPVSNYIESIKYQSKDDDSTYLVIALDEKCSEKEIDKNESDIIVNEYVSCEDEESSDNQLVLSKTSGKASKRTIQCTKCLKTFSYKYKLARHRCGEKESYRCDVCSAVFSLKWNLKRHKLIHSGEKIYMCETCGKGFSQKGTLEEHKRIHTGDKPYICNFCGIGLRRMQDLNVHLAKHSSPDEDEYAELPNSEKKKFQCKICQKTTASVRALRLHKSMHHAAKTYLCSVCGKGFVAKQGLVTHAKIHSGDKPFACEFCPKKFAYKSTLKDHVFTHTGDRPHVCNICQKAFVQQHHLMQHLFLHSGEKPYNCQLCDKSFSLRGNLTVHMRIHSGVTPFTCTVCSMAFTDSSNFRKHKIKNGH